jgi:penicillin-binding protein 1A
VTLLELTSAFAGVSGNSWPVSAHGLATEDPGIIARLLGRSRSFDARTHAMLLDLLSATVREGTGQSASLAIDAYGKTGTSQDNRDALFIGFAGDLVVGVWVGNDDNTPLKGMTGGGVPARIWRDFMSAAVRGAKPAAPRRIEKPVEELPVDLNMSLGDNMSLQMGNDSGVSINGDLAGVPLNVRIDSEGVSLEPGPRRKPPTN